MPSRKVYDLGEVAAVRFLYGAGMTMKEVAEVGRSTTHVVFKLMRDNDVAPRPAVRRHNRFGKARTEGHDQTSVGICWKNMIDRCDNPDHFAYRNYGGRGIEVCDRWRYGDGDRSGFECFMADMGERSSPDHSIDRFPDNDGNYEPGNCRWATRSEQARNRRFHGFAA